MAKRKKSITPKSDTKVVAIVIGLFAAAIILFFIFTKSKESAKENVPTTNGPVEVSAPVENNKPAEAELTYTPQPVAEEPQENVSGRGARVAIILDDWGQSTISCKYLREIPEPLAVSILPGLRHTKDVANCAKMYHKLTMLHLPLEAMHNYDFYPPNYIIKTSMSPSLVSQIVVQDLDQLPSIEGVNNHMGSKATGDRALMKIIFRIIRKKGLFFVDSMTSRYSVSAALADEMGLAYGKRDVFLDNLNNKEAIAKQFVVLAQKARRRGYAVAIGHDRPVTMKILKEEISWLESQGIQIVSIKDLLKHR